MDESPPSPDNQSPSPVDNSPSADMDIDQVLQENDSEEPPRQPSVTIEEVEDEDG
jgi:hypothetical protein